MDRTALEQVVASLPQKPGVYRFKDSAGEVIYVGKAVNLRNRVRSYFADHIPSTKVRNMALQIADLEVTTVASELEALVLECNLIKQLRPKYNIRLKDDKHYPYVRVSVEEQWPRVDITRRYAKDGARYFGPYTDTRSVYTTLNLLNKLFRFRRCNIEITGKEPRPCLDFHIHRCLGPCIGAASHDDYVDAINQVCLFLDGRHEQIIKTLKKKMKTLSAEMQYERAGYVRDQVAALQTVVTRQRVVSTASEDQDVIALARNDGEACVEVFLIRGGKLIAGEHFMLANSADEDAQSLLSTFVTQYYDSTPFVPPHILVQHDLTEATVIQSWLQTKRGSKVSVRVPRRGGKAQLMDLAASNAAGALEQMRAKWMADRAKTTTALTELADNLDLTEPPARIECYDISNTQGTNSVGSMVVFIDGQPSKDHYRRFQIKTVEGSDDFASMREVLRRRFKRAKTTEDWNPPNLVIVDGGKGQLNAAREVFTELEVEGVALASLAKENEELFVPNQSQSILLPRTSQSLYLVQRIRDEAHRFALSYHQKLRKRHALKSPLDEVHGIGPKRKSALLRKFGSLSAIRQASEEEIASVPGMTRAAAAALRAKM